MMRFIDVYCRTNPIIALALIPRWFYSADKTIMSVSFNWMIPFGSRMKKRRLGSIKRHFRCVHLLLLVNSIFYVFDRKRVKI